MRIKITANGPYLISGGVALTEKIITPVGKHYELREGRELPQAERYALCRCGHSANAPFCDGTHHKIDFDGTEVAAREPYLERVDDVIEGATMDLLDDGRCAFARFCHTERGDVWHLTMSDTDEENRAAAIKAASECPAGRLVMISKSGTVLEEEAAGSIYVLQDPQKGTSAELFVHGPVTIESENGNEYELRNRQALCRCGASANKPFCDASHVVTAYNDGHCPA